MSLRQLQPGPPPGRGGPSHIGQGGRGNQPHQLFGPSSTQNGGRQDHQAAAGAANATSTKRAIRAKDVVRIVSNASCGMQLGSWVERLCWVLGGGRCGHPSGAGRVKKKEIALPKNGMGAGQRPSPYPAFRCIREPSYSTHYVLAGVAGTKRPQQRRLRAGMRGPCGAALSRCGPPAPNRGQRRAAPARNRNFFRDLASVVRSPVGSRALERGRVKRENELSELCRLALARRLSTTFSNPRAQTTDRRFTRKRSNTHTKPVQIHSWPRPPCKNEKHVFAGWGGAGAEPRPGQRAHTLFTFFFQRQPAARCNAHRRLQWARSWLS